MRTNNENLNLLACVICLLTSMLFAGCSNSSSIEIINMDVTRNYPNKELILQEFMDVEYVLLESNEEFVVSNTILAIGEKYIILKNTGNEGTVFSFDRKTGRALYKFNHRGQGPEEYTFINSCVLDEDNNEIFINDAVSKKIVVYDIFGNYRRNLIYKEGAEYMNMFLFGKEGLIAYDMSEIYKDGENKGNESYYRLLSRKDGRIIKEINIPYEVIQGTIAEKDGMMAVFLVNTITPYKGDFFISETSTDTIYRYVAIKNELIPFIVKSKTSNPEYYISMETMTDQYFFMRVFKNELDTRRMTVPSTEMVYDKQEKNLYNPIITNKDYKELTVSLTPINRNDITAYQVINADKLVKAYKEKKLQGKLNEICATLKEDSNPVIVIMKSK